MTPLLQEQKNIATIHAILEDEVRGDVAAALDKMTADYSMTWVLKKKNGALFPTVTGATIRESMKEAYEIKGREYKIQNIVAQGNVVIAEMIESYPDPEKPNMVYRTPQVIVWEFEGGKIKTGRHYCDPHVSYLGLSEEEIKKIYK